MAYRRFRGPKGWLRRANKRRYRQARRAVRRTSYRVRRSLRRAFS